MLDYTLLTSKIDALLAAKNGAPLLIAIDGRCGCGKTTLAAKLNKRFGGNAAHMDDFYLPFDMRADGWDKTPCANMDLQRFYSEVLQPAKEGAAITYKAYCCRSGAFLPAKVLQPAPLFIAEGSYSTHPMLKACYDLTVFVTAPKAEQISRLKQREGANYLAFASRWMPLEEAYFAMYGIQQSADVVVET